jgi:hypothetical protein
MKIYVPENAKLWPHVVLIVSFFVAIAVAAFR